MMRIRFPMQMQSQATTHLTRHTTPSDWTATSPTKILSPQTIHALQIQRDHSQEALIFPPYPTFSTIWQSCQRKVLIILIVGLSTQRWLGQYLI